MLPFIDISGLKIPMYGLMIVTGVTLGVLVAVYFPYRKSISRDDIIFAFCYAGIGAFIGAKLLYLVTAVPGLFFSEQPQKITLALIIDLFRRGFIFYGGVFGGILAVYIYIRRYKLSFINVIETLMVSLPLIHAIGRIGCFCAGCCYGRPAEPPWGMYFRADSVAPNGVALFPIQLLESFINLVLFVVLFIYSRKQRRSGQIVGFYFIGYGIERFVLEYFRYDAVPILAGLTLSQIISVILIPAGIVLLVKPEIFKLGKKNNTEN